MQSRVYVAGLGTLSYLLNGAKKQIPKSEMSELQAIETSPVEPNHVVDLTIPEATPWEFEAHFDSMAAKRFVQDSWVHTSIISLFIYFTFITAGRIIMANR